MGIQEIIVGFRTPAGKLTTTQSFKTMQIPRMVRDKPGAWEPSICLDFGQRFLAFLKNVVQDSRPGPPSMIPKVWRARFVPRIGVTLSLLDENCVNEVRAEDDRYGFLPNGYWETLEKDIAIQKQSSEGDHPVMSGCESAAVLPPGWMI